MPPAPPETPPADLGTAGAGFWVSVTAKYVLSPAELELLYRAAKITDLLHRVDETIAKEGLTVAGSTGNIVANPLLRSQVELSRTFDTLIRSLALPLPDEKAGKIRTPSASIAAKARWGP